MYSKIFKIPNVEVLDTVVDVTREPCLLFRNLSDGYITSIAWDSSELNSESFWKSISEKISSLVYNRVKFEDKIYKTKSELLAYITSVYPNYTPDVKLNLVLEYISGLTEFEGQKINLNIIESVFNLEVWRRYFFNNAHEFLFYIENLRDQNLITYEDADYVFLNLQITLKGLTALLKINEQKTSRICFVAMSFDVALENVYDQAIVPALSATGFVPYIVRNEQVDSDRTINDAIISGIKKARFTIADFTQHKAGVYFEAGYALGRGQKVIYACQKDEIGKAHFDTRNFQHIVWDTPEDFKIKLVDKIEAFIKD